MGHRVIPLCLLFALAGCGRSGFEGRAPPGDGAAQGDEDHTAVGDAIEPDTDRDLTPPEVTVTAPDGAEIWAGGSARSVTWIATDASGIAPGSIAIEFSSDGGGTWSSVASLEANDGSYAWVVPLVDTSAAIIRVTATDAAGNTAGDSSNATFTIDSTAPALASATVTNASPTTVRSFALSYGAVTGPYDDTCILVNSTTVGACSWLAGALPTVFIVDPVVEVKTLSIWLRDAAGNVSVRVDTNPISYLPSLSLTPATFTAALVDTATVIAASHEFAERVVADDGQVYLLGGYFSVTPDANTTHSVSSVHSYDPTTEQWTSRAPMAERRAHFSAVKLSDGRFWVGGGLRWNTGAYAYLRDTEIYDPLADTWTKRRDLPAERYRYNAVRFTAADGRDRIAVIGGKQNLTTTVATIFIYDPLTDTWSDGPTMSSARSDGVAVTLGDGRIFVGAGMDGAELVTYGIYDPLASTWTPGANTMANTHSRPAGFFVPAAATGFSYDAVALFGGGVGTGMTPQNRVDILRLDTGAWRSGANMSATVGEGPIVAVGGDRFLRVGGVTGSVSAASATVQEYDLSDNVWTAKASLPIARGWHTVTLLDNDKVLVAGGVPLSYLEALPKNFLYTQGSPGSWAETGHFHIQTENHRALRLADGKVLKCGGFSTLTGTVIRDCFRFDPATGNWDTVGKMGTARQDHMMVLLPTGDVLVAGGQTDDALNVTNTAELYDAATGVFTPTGSFTDARRHAKLVVLQGGAAVLLAGGNNGHTTGGTYFRNAQTYAIATGTWSAAGTMNADRGNHAIALLDDGRVFVAGGFNGASTNNSCEIYDPGDDSWTAGPTANAQHGAPLFAHTGTGVNERVYVVGGFATNGGTATTVNEYYDVTTPGWVLRAPLPSSRWNMGQLLTTDGMLYAFGGLLNSVVGGTPTTDVERYSIAANTWTAITPVHGLQSAWNRYAVDSNAIALADGRVLITGFGTAVRSTELYAFVTTQTFTAQGGDLDYTLSLLSGLGTFYPTTGLYVPQPTDFTARGGPGSTTTRVQVVDGEGHTDEAAITIP